MQRPVCTSLQSADIRIRVANPELISDLTRKLGKWSLHAEFNSNHLGQRVKVALHPLTWHISGHGGTQFAKLRKLCSGDSAALIFRK
jgi:hypothetical protein